MKWLLASVLMLLATPANSQSMMSTQIFFECKTAELAREVAEMEEVTYGVTGLPVGCYWVYGERNADILEIDPTPVMKPTEILWIGKVKRHLAPEAWSAGRMNLEMT